MHLQFFPGAQAIKKPEQIIGKIDLVVLVDCATLDRVGEGWLAPYLATAPLVVIDHHAMRDDIPSVAVIDPSAAATGQLIYHLVSAMAVPISQEIANCLYGAISSDTGGFRFANTTASAFAVAAELMQYGVDMEAMRTNLFESKTMTNLAMMGYAILHMQQSEDKKLVWTIIDGETKAAYGATSADCDNISGYTMYPMGGKVGIFFEEIPEKAMIKLSMRCRKGYNVGKLAASFGGGGHVLAAGCKISGALTEVVELVLAKAREMIESCEAEAVDLC